MSAVLHAARAPLLDDKRNADAPHSWIKELVAQLRLLLPIYTSNILEFGQGAFTVIVVGRLGVRELAAQGIAVSPFQNLYELIEPDAYPAYSN